VLKFKQIRLSNFLVFRDASIDFATDGRVTVLRAENGSGKTTLLRAMEWVIYGDEALPRARQYRLHPPDHSMPEDGPLTVSVELDVDVDGPEGVRAATIRRSSDVKPAGDSWQRSLSEAEFRFDDGTPGDEDTLEALLPWRLREFFFTDGDKATDYVGGLDEAEIVSSTKAAASSARGNVTEAIQSLLGLDLLDAVRSKAAQRSRDLDTELARSSGSGALAAASEKQRLAQEHHATVKADVAKSEEERRSLTVEIDDLETRRDALLRSGDPDELQRQVAAAEKRLKRSREKLELAQREEARTLTSAPLTYAATAPALQDFVERAEPLVESGVVPATYLWWVRRRLDEGTCMCGCGLDPAGSSADRERHDAVMALISRSEEETRSANHAGDLYYHLHGQLESLQHNGWLEQLAAALQAQRDAQEEVVEAERTLDDLEPKLKLVKDSPVESLRRQLANLRARDKELDKTVSNLAREVKAAYDESVTADRQLDAARRRAHTAGDIGIKSALYRDALEVLRRAKATRTGDDIEALSARMNELFKRMIGNHEILAEVRVSRSETDAFEVEGIGMDGSRMDVSHQFNGASKRALTNAFVLALGETAGVRAPHVIDTPLGMMDPSVRRNVFEVMSKECVQLVLLLTRSEITGIEEMLDASGLTATVTNQGSGEIVNRQFEDARSVVCGCSHREYCAICERVGDEASSPLVRRAA
jgi:DNA sulfur modification protein DndD